MTTIRGRLFVCVLAVLLTASMALAADAPQAKLPLTSPSAIALVRLKGLNTGIKALSNLIAEFDANAAKEMENEIKQGLGDLKGVDADGPCAILFLDPKKYQEVKCMVGVFTLADAEKWKTVEIAQTQVVGKIGLIGEDKDAVGEVAGALQAAGVNAIPTADMKDLLVGTADLPSILGRYKTDIQGLMQIGRLQLGGGMEAAPADATKKMGLKALEYADKLLKELEAQTGLVQMGVSAETGQVTSHIVVEAAPGSDFANFLAKQNRPAGVAALSKFLPKEAYTTSVQSFDPVSAGDMGVGFVKILADIAALTPDETAAIVKIASDHARNLTGFGASASVVVKDGQGQVSLVGINDADAARASMKAMVGQAGAGTVGDFLKKYGVAVTLTEKARTYKDIPVDKLEVSADLDKLLAALPVPDAQKTEMKKGIGRALKASFGAENKFVMEMVYGKKLLVTGMGLESDKLLEKVVDLMKGGGVDGIGVEPEYLAAVARHPKESMMFGHFSLFGYADVLSKMMTNMTAEMGMPMPMNMFPTRAELPPVETPISFSMVADGNKAVVYAHVPIKPIKDYADAMKKKVKAMMEQMGRNMAPPGGALPPPLN